MRQILVYPLVIWSMLKQGSPGAPGAPGSTGPKGLHGDHGPPVSIRDPFLGSEITW